MYIYCLGILGTVVDTQPPSFCPHAVWWQHGFAKHAIICLEAFLLNFTGGSSSGKTHTADCCFVSGSYWYTQVASPVTMSRTRGDLPPSNFLSMWVHQSTLSRFRSSLRLWGTQRARFLTPRQSRKMRVRLPDEIFMISCISVYTIFGSFLIRDSTLKTFSRVMVIAIRPQRSSFSNVLTLDMDCLNHLKTVTLGGEWSPRQCFKLWQQSWKDFPGSNHNTS